MLNIDVSRPLKRPSQLQALVAAVFEANANDETDWVEWKIDLDLDTHDGQGTVARHILGFANRDPAMTGRVVEGYGYLVIGVEPGSCPGISRLPPTRRAILSYP